MAENQIETEEHKRWKQFISFFKKHRYIQPHGIINCDENKQPSPLKFIIHSIKAISVGFKEPEQATNLYAFLNVTFLSKKKSKFFGRTYKSEPIVLTETGKNSKTFEMKGFHSLYCHTVVEDNADSRMVVELEVKEIHEANKTVINEALIGWTIVEGVMGVKPHKQVQFYKGTARHAVSSSETDSKGVPIPTVMELEIQKMDGLAPIVSLIPSSVLVGCDEEVPGCAQNKIPNTRETANLSTVTMRDLFLEKIHLSLSPDIQKAIKDDCRKFRTNKYGAINAKVGDVYIQEIKLYSYFHNGWTAVSKEGFRNYIVLKKLSDNEYDFQGTFPVNDVFVHPLACLILQIEVVVKIPLENTLEDSSRIVLGWKPLFIENHMLSLITPQSKELILGPGKSLSFDTLFELSTKSTDTKAILDFEINMTNIINREQVPRNMNASNLGASALGRKQDLNSPEFMELRNQLKKLNKEKEDLRKQLDKTTGLFLERDQGLNNSAVARYDVDSDKFDEMYRRDIMEIKQSIDELKRNNQGLGNSQMLFPSQVNPHLYNDPRLLPSNVDPRDKANYEALNLKGQPLYNNQEMTRTDRANLLAHGVNGLVDVNGTNDKAIAHLNLKLEYEDHRKVSTFSVQFLSIKYIPIGDSTKIVGFSIPDSLFMTFDFFNSPMKKTKTLSYMNVSSEEMRLKPELYAHKQMILINQDFVRGKGTIKESIHQFEVNPAVEGSMAIHTKYIRYLAEKELHIDLWDGDSLMHFGKARVKLHNVLRQGKEIEIYTPTVEVFDEETKTIKASLQLTLKNQGTPVDQRVSAYPEEQEHFSFNKTSKGGKYKVKSLLPMDIEKELAGGFDGTRVLTNEEIEDEEKRKRLRVNRYKVLKSTLSKTAANKLNVSEVESFHNSLRDIEAIREKKKPEVINKAILKGFSEEHVVSTVFGETKLLSYKFQNMLQTQADYKLKVEVTNGLSPKEFRVVSHPEEWQSCVAKLKVERPPEWGMLETGQIFSLKAGESVTLIFKFLTYDENEISGKSAGKKVGNVSICDIGGSLIAGLSFQFRVAHPVIDRSISFHELESRNALLVLPPFFNSENTALNRPEVLLTNEKVVVDWVSNAEARLKLRVGPSPSVESFYMFAYTDHFRTSLYGIWRVLVHAQSGYDVNSEMGAVVRCKLPVVTALPRMCRVFASNNKMIHFEREFKAQFEILPGANNVVYYSLRGYKPGTEKIAINVVDNNSKELIQGWTLRVTTLPPNPDQTFSERVSVNKIELIAKPFLNRLNEYARYEIEASNPALLDVVEPLLEVEAGQKANVKLRILPQKNAFIGEVLLFIVETESRHSECWKFIINVAF